jgi:hypothetical protein
MKRLPGLMIWFLLLISLAMPSLLLAAMIEGRIVSGDEPLAGVVITAHSSLDFKTKALARSVVSDSDGLYQMELPPGTYALFGWSDDQSQFAFCGRNPVNLTKESTWVGLQAVPVETSTNTVYDDDYSAAIEGQVLHDGSPLAGAYVYLYLDVAEDLKGQGYRLSLPTGTDGYFRFDGLPESNYYLVVRHRQNGQRVGPVQEGDQFGIFPGNPLTARSGQVQQVKVHSVTKLKDASGSETFGRATGPVLSGTVVNTSGQGVAGVHVFAYVDRVIGHQRPAAISTPTADDGRFVVNLPEPGTYYVGAREAYGDSPAPGELFGMYEESADHGLTLEKGKNLADVRIVVEPVAIF